MSGTEVREQLLQAALRVYAVAGVRGATTRRIAHEAGVNEVTLLRHFGSKDTLLQEALASGCPRSRRIRSTSCSSSAAGSTAGLWRRVP
jgi:AcrR family transcriptional regulator